MRLFVSVCVCTVVLASSLLTPRGEEKSDICDDGKYHIWKDMESYECHDDQRGLFVLSEYHSPAGTSQCANQTDHAVPRCMNEDIDYDSEPPTSGDYRPQAPMYGTYSFLPPQRWLHALELGAVAFLFHPCAPPDQVQMLKNTARGCLWRHVITPYLHLDPTHPFALVSWGCVYRMSWVNPAEVKEWVKAHALQTHLPPVNGQYNEALLKEAEVVSTPMDDILCPGDKETPHSTDASESPSPPPPPHSTQPSGPATLSGDIDQHMEATDQPINNCSTQDPTPCPTHHVLVVVQHHTSLITLIVLTSLVLVVVVTVLSWKLFGCECCRIKRRKRSRYKRVSKFFPFSYGKDVGEEAVALPELGPPKTMAAERETLLNDSDEDSI